MVVLSGGLRVDFSWPSNIMTGSRIDFLDAAPGCVELEAMSVYSLGRLAGICR